MQNSFKRWVLLYACILCSACSPTNEDYLVGTLERDRIEVIAERSEPITELHVREGDHVAPGSKILQLDSSREQAQLQQLQANRNNAQRRLDELIRGPREEVIAEVQARRRAAQTELDNTREELNRLRPLRAEGLVSEADYDNAETAYEAAQGSYQAISAELEALLEGTTIEVLDQARAQVEAAEADLARQNIVINRLEITAPRAAVVESLPWKQGSQPPAGAAVAILVADQAPFIRTYIPADKLHRFKQTDEVKVKLVGFGDYTGKVRWISSVASFTPYYALTEHDRDRLSYTAEIDLVGADIADLPSGIPAQIWSLESEPQEQP